MAKLTPVEFDPFAESKQTLTPVDYDPFAAPTKEREMRSYDPGLLDRLRELFPGDRERAMNEVVAKRIAKRIAEESGVEESGVSVDDVYKAAGGSRPKFNPEGEAAIDAARVEGGKAARGLGRVPGAIEQGWEMGVGGAAQMMGEIPMASPVVTSMIDNIRDSHPNVAGYLDNIWSSEKVSPELAQYGKDLYTAALKEQQAGTPADESFLEQAIVSAGQSTGQALPALGVAALFKKPEVAGPLIFGGQETARAYGEARNKSLNPSDSISYAIRNGVIEAGTEFLPLKALFKRDPSFGRKIVNFLAKEVPSENVAEISQQANSVLSGVDPEMTVGEFISSLPDLIARTTAATIIGGGIQTGTVHGAQTIAERIRKDPIQQASDKILSGTPDDMMAAVSEIFADQETGIDEAINDAVNTVFEEAVAPATEAKDTLAAVDVAAPQILAPQQQAALDRFPDTQEQTLGIARTQADNRAYRRRAFELEQQKQRENEAILEQARNQEAALQTAISQVNEQPQQPTALQLAMQKAQQRREANAIKIESSKEPYADVRQQGRPEERTGSMPAGESSGGVREGGQAQEEVAENVPTTPYPQESPQAAQEANPLLAQEGRSVLPSEFHVQDRSVLPDQGQIIAGQTRTAPADILGPDVAPEVYNAPQKQPEKFTIRPQGQGVVVDVKTEKELAEVRGQLSQAGVKAKGLYNAKTGTLQFSKDQSAAVRGVLEGGAVAEMEAPMTPGKAARLKSEKNHVGVSRNDKAPASWVIREKATGNVVMETYDTAKVDALNTGKYEAIPIADHLRSLNTPSPESGQARPNSAAPIKYPSNKQAVVPKEETAQKEGGDQQPIKSPDEAILSEQAGRHPTKDKFKSYLRGRLGAEKLKELDNSGAVDRAWADANPVDKDISDKNIGREWNSSYGRQRIVSVDPGNPELGIEPMYDVKTAGSGEIRRYSANRIEDVIKRNEHELTPEYAKEKEERAEIDRLRAENSARAKDRAAKEDREIADFTVGMTDVQAGRVRAALLHQVGVNGIPMTRKAWMEKAIADGRTVEGSDNGRKLLSKDGAFWNEKTTTKIAMDYAEYLRRDKNNVNETAESETKKAEDAITKMADQKESEVTKAKEALQAAGVTGKELREAIKDVRKGELTADEVIESVVATEATSKKEKTEHGSKPIKKDVFGSIDEEQTRAIKRKQMPETIEIKIPKPEIPSKLSQREFSDILQDIDGYGPVSEDDPDRAQEFRSIVRKLKKAGIYYIDLYHVTDADLQDFEGGKIKGSAVDYIGRSGSNARESSVYGFLDPSDIKKGYDGILGAESDIPNVIHAKVPVDRIDNFRWDSNYNLTYGTYSGVRFIGDIPHEWISGSYRYDLSTGRVVDYQKGTFSPDDAHILYGEPSPAKKAKPKAISPSDKAVYGMAAEGKSAKDILKSIRDTSENADYKKLANHLMMLGLKPSVSIGDQAGFKFRTGEGTYGAAYIPDSDSIILMRPSNSERNFLHEMMHAATHREIDRNGKSATNLKLLYSYVKKTSGLDAYGMSNAHEFIAEAFTNPKFQQELRKIKAPFGSKLRSAWDSFVGIIKKMLGLPQNYDNTVLSAVLKAGTEIMEESARSRNGTEAAQNEAALGSKEEEAGEVETGGLVGDRFIIPAETRGEQARRKIQDDAIRIQKVQNAVVKQGGVVTEESNIREAIFAYPGRLSAKIGDLTKKIVDPLLERMISVGVTMDDVGLYKYALHAKERNAEMAKIRKDLPNDGKPGNSGSGMTDEMADELIKQAEAHPQFKAIKEASDVLDKIMNSRLNFLVKEGVMTKDQADAYRAKYKHYVPLKGFENADVNGVSQGTGRGLSTGRKIDFRALGRKSMARDVFQNIIRDAEAAMMLAEKSHVGKVARNFVQANPDAKLWGVENIPKDRYFKKGGEIHVVYQNGAAIAEFKKKGDDAAFVKQLKTLYPDEEFTVKTERDEGLVVLKESQFNENEEIMFIEGSDVVRIQFTDPLMTRAYNRLWNNGVSDGLKLLNDYNALLRQTYTQKNPAFFVLNAFRDVQAVVPYLAGEKGAKFAVKTMGNMLGAKKAAWNFYHGKPLGPVWTDLMERFRHAGGSVGFAYVGDIEAKTQELEGSLARYTSWKDTIAGVKKGNIKRGMYGVLVKSLNSKGIAWIEALNTSFENMSRLATFKAAIDSGLSDQEAAMLSKHVTVNFNTRGEWGPNMNAVWLFSNASVQGSRNIGHALLYSPHKKQVWALAGGLMAMGVVAGLMGDDDDDLVRGDERGKSLIFKFGDTVIKVPMSYGWGFFGGMGQLIAQSMKHPESHDKIVVEMADLTMQHFGVIGNPFAGGSDDLAGMVNLLPTAPKPFAQAAFNRSSFGGPLYPEFPYDETVPDSEKAWRTTKGSAYDRTAKWLNDMSGGDAAQAGWMSVSPESIKLGVNTVGGGVGRLVTDLFSLPFKATSDEEMSSKDFPIWKNFVGSIGEDDYVRRFNEQASKAKDAYKIYQNYQQKGDIEGLKAYIAENNAMIALGNMVQSYQEQLKKYREYEDFLKNNMVMSDMERKTKLKAIDEARKKLASSFNEKIKGM